MPPLKVSETMTSSLEHDIPPSDLKGPRIDSPSPVDILLGRGKPFHCHQGNQRMLQIVDEHRVRYLKADRKHKHIIIEQIINLIRSYGGRFICRVDYENYWVEVNHAIAYRKVGHAFRSKARKHAKGAREVVKTGASSDVNTGTAALRSAPETALRSLNSSSAAGSPLIPRPSGYPPASTVMSKRLSMSEEEYLALRSRQGNLMMAPRPSYPSLAGMEALQQQQQQQRHASMYDLPESMKFGLSGWPQPSPAFRNSTAELMMNMRRPGGVYGGLSSSMTTAGAMSSARAGAGGGDVSTFLTPEEQVALLTAKARMRAEMLGRVI